ncbi:hypothetical protein D4741_18430 [Pseudoalteromonas gelatinilytica]|uniref:ABC transporter substrate-binding protein n=1 Tax=Pseudoalteromonas gelatinilytica TaxID=1703256 RepID=A0A3A3EEU8_9GAMM|nr:hypothetical protein D4741_18430 [Pseudoalteromonas profundi]
MFIRDDVYDDYSRFLNGRKPIEDKDFSGAYIRRDVVDMIIAQQALSLGGFTKPFRYHKGNVNYRNTKLLEDGQLLLSFDSVWSVDAKQLAESVYISDPVIRNGEYFAGIFTSPNNKKVLKVKQLADFKQLTAVSTPRWQTDWQTLSDLPLKELLREDEWLGQVRTVSMQWVDFMMMPLMPSLNNRYSLENIELVAVPNLVLQLNDSRHFIISKSHPDGKAAFAAIQKGLSQLRKTGAIEKAYREAGFIPDLNSYTVINKAR